MEFFTETLFKTLANPGVASVQLLSPHNSRSTRLTVTRVTVEPGATQPRHVHDASEQVWIALSGSGRLLLDGGAAVPFAAGQVVRFAEGDVHGLHNTGVEPFAYLSITSPPIDFSRAYGKAR